MTDPSDDHAEIIRRGFDARIRVTKEALAKWAANNEQLGASGTITVAMLELGIERHLDLFPDDEKSAADLVQGVLRKVLRRRRGPLQ
jgi:hypothetical protein